MSNQLKFDGILAPDRADIGAAILQVTAELPRQRTSTGSGATSPNTAGRPTSASDPHQAPATVGSLGTNRARCSVGRAGAAVPMCQSPVRRQRVSVGRTGEGVSMRATVQVANGSTGVLRLSDIDRPVAGEGEVLVRVGPPLAPQPRWAGHRRDCCSTTAVGVTAHGAQDRYSPHARAPSRAWEPAE